MTTASFPQDFLWGIAGAAHCLEGASGGRGATIWEPFCSRSGAIRDGSTAQTACDQVRRWPEDLENQRRLGVSCCRFSISWARVFPDGAGAVNLAGMDYYQRLVDSLAAVGIRPLAVLYHWDLPQAVEDQGGWPDRDTARRFADYAAYVFQRLSDRVGMWVTHHDPWASAFHGYGSGALAPGLRSEEAAVKAAHVLLLSHAFAVQACAPFRRGGDQIGVALGLSPVRAETPEDEEAAFWADAYLNRWALEPLMLGHYPQELLEIYTARHPRWELRPEDLDAMAGARPDFLGVNYFTSRRVNRRAGPGELFAFAARGSGPSTATGWEQDPVGLRELLVRLDREYGSPQLLVTANGASFEEAPGENGVIEDRERIAFLEEHLEQAHRALRLGVRLKGFFPWALMDGFEWSFGYSRPFGLIAVDRGTLKRTWKRSAFWYRDVIEAGGF